MVPCVRARRCSCSAISPYGSPLLLRRPPCHGRSPLDFILFHWRDGALGALASGIGHGFFCLGCCWMLMALLFVGGIMNLAWIAGIALLVLIEKTLPRGRRVSQVTGAVLVAWGA